MDISIFLAKFWGWYFLIFFLILGYNPTRVKQIFGFLRDPKFLIIAAFIAIVFGLLSILFHNIWELNWKIIITLIGWAALFIGLLLFIFPGKTIKWIDFINLKLVQILCILLFLVGVFLLNTAYGILLY